MAAPPQHTHEVYVGNTTPNPKWLALLKAATLRLEHGGFARNMVRWGSVLLLGVIQLLSLVGSAGSMVPMGSALSTSAPLLHKQEDCVASMGVAARKCARRKAAALLLKHVVYVASMMFI